MAVVYPAGVFRPLFCGKISTMPSGSRWILRISAHSAVARRVLDSGMQAVAGVAALALPDARKIAGVRRAPFGAKGRAVIPVTASPFLMPHRLIASALTVCMLSAGLSPCLASLMAAPVSQHDCCPPKMTEGGSTESPTPMMAGGPADCCVVAPRPLAAATVPVVTTPAPDHTAATFSTPVLHQPFAPSAFSRASDPRARSAPRPPQNAVLLI